MLVVKLLCKLMMPTNDPTCVYISMQNEPQMSINMKISLDIPSLIYIEKDMNRR